MGRYVPAPAPFITPQLNGGAIAAVLIAAAKGIMAGAADEFQAIGDPYGDKHRTYREVYEVTQGGGLPNVEVLAGVSGPYVNSIEFGTPSGAGPGTKGGWRHGAYIISSRL